MKYFLLANDLKWVNIIVNDYEYLVFKTYIYINMSTISLESHDKFNEFMLFLLVKIQKT